MAGFSVTRFGFGCVDFSLFDVDCILSLVGCGCVLAVANQGQGVFV
jgi:hypothetical protein